MESVFETKEQYLEFVKHWKSLVNSKERAYNLTLRHFIIYRMIKGKDWKVCVSESSKKETKEYANNIAYELNPKYMIKGPFEGYITEEMIIKSRQIMMSGN